MMTERMAPFKILSLDGGGVRGAYTAYVLQRLEEAAGAPLHTKFDLITGTSTGGLLALGTALGKPPTSMLDLYREKAGSIFKQPCLGLWGLAKQIWGSKHAQGHLRAELQAFFGDAVLDDCLTNVCVPAVNAATGRPRVFKTPHNDALHEDYKLPAWKIALATAAAPTYLPGAQVEDGDAYVDGGLWANNPSIVGLIEAITYLDQRPDRISVLSIGTGSHKTGFPAEKVRRPSKGFWVRGAAPELLLATQSDAVHFQMRLLSQNLGFHYRRINPTLPEKWDLDDSNAVDRVLAFATDTVRDTLVNVRSEFLESEPP